MHIKVDVAYTIQHETTKNFGEEIRCIHNDTQYTLFPLVENVWAWDTWPQSLVTGKAKTNRCALKNICGHLSSMFSIHVFTKTFQILWHLTY
jgi:hypothetical protein